MSFNGVEECEIELSKRFGGNLPQITCLEDLVRELNLIFADDSVNIDLVDYVMKSYKSNPLEWKKYAKFDRFR